MNVNTNNYINSLPDEILLNIFEYVPVKDVFKNLPLVCQNWNRLAKDEQFQKNIYYSFFSNPPIEGASIKDSIISNITAYKLWGWIPKNRMERLVAKELIQDKIRKLENIFFNSGSAPQNTPKKKSRFKKLLSKIKQPKDSEDKTVNTVDVKATHTQYQLTSLLDCALGGLYFKPNITRILKGDSVIPVIKETEMTDPIVKWSNKKTHGYAIYLKDDSGNTFLQHMSILAKCNLHPDYVNFYNDGPLEHNVEIFQSGIDKPSYLFLKELGNDGSAVFKGKRYHLTRYEEKKDAAGQ